MIILSAIVLSGCVHYQPQPLNAGRRAEDFESRRLDDDKLRGFMETNLGHTITNWPVQQWNLETLTLAAFYFQASLDVARAQWRVAEAAAISAGARPNPMISFSPGFTANAADATPWMLAGGFDWPIETAGKRKLRVVQARQLTSVARFNLISTAWQVRTSVRDNLAAYRFAGNLSGVIGQKVALQKQIVAKLDARLKAGAIASAEVSPARIALRRLEAELSVARNNENVASAQLAQAIGVSLRTLTNVPKEMTLYTPQLSNEQLTEAKKRALLTRADLLASLAEYDASETLLELEIAKQYPDIHFNPNYQYDQGANKWALGVSLELPLLNHNQGPIAEAKAKRDETAARFTALQAKVISDIDAAAENFQQVRQRHFDLIPTVNVELQHEHAMEAQLRAGAADALDLLNAKLERLTGVALFDESGYRSEVAFGKLEDAMQQLLGVKPVVIAPPPPEHLEKNPRVENTKP